MLYYTLKTSKNGYTYPCLLVKFQSGKTYTLPAPPRVADYVIKHNNIPPLDEVKR